ncbi:MAG: alpha/beta hydrolase [Burkholderiaceae bacterium]|nr:MAG: alpha/beta hydrolase [Burkholderiaceae bacterium]
MQLLKKIVVCSAMLASSAAWAEQPYGDWMGTLAGSLRIKIQVSKSEDGKPQVKLTSIDQGNSVIMADSTDLAENKLEFAISRLGASYKASWDQATQQWQGEWMQAGQRMKLDLSALKGEAPAPVKKNRPQVEAIKNATPTYINSDVQFTGLDSSMSLAGTMCLPNGKGPFPAAVLVHGSGPHTRHEELFGHQIFTVIADHLCKQGIAVLRYDKRGVGASKGVYKTATSLDFADDAQAAVNFLRLQPQIDAKRVGIIGHSEGGMIAPVVASRDPQLGFVILMGGPGIAIDQLMLEQVRDGMKAEGAVEAGEQQAKRYRKVYELMLAEKDVETLRTKLRELMMSEANAIEKSVQLEIDQLTSPWFLTFIRFQPQQYLSKLKQPVLAINGELDFQVSAKSNLAGIRQAMKANPKLTALELPKLNHLFQTSTTGAFSEYDKIEETVAPLALNTMSDWLKTQLKMQSKTSKK